MKIVVLTTKTDHHTYFINTLIEHFKNVYVVYETKRLKKPYKVGPFFEEEESDFNKRFFKNTANKVLLSDDNILIVDDVNNKDSIAFIKKISPDICISFGTGLIKKKVFNLPKFGTINIHRGIVQKYRGLDSDLWAILNNDILSIGTTIHFIDEKFDTGNIIDQDFYSVTKNDQIFHLKYHTTIIATNLIVKALKTIKHDNKKPENQKQKSLGKYYTAMSIEKKLEAHKIFEREKLKNVK